MEVDEDSVTPFGGEAEIIRRRGGGGAVNRGTEREFDRGFELIMRRCNRDFRKIADDEATRIGNAERAGDADIVDAGAHP